MSPLLEVAAAVSLILACLTAVGVMGRKLWRGTRKVVHAVEIIQRELNPNGGGSTYDRAKVAAEAAVQAETKAEQVAANLSAFQQHQAVDSAAATAALAKVQHDVTNVRAGQEALLAEVDGLRDAARDATMAAATAVAESKLGRTITAEAAERTRDQIGDLRKATTVLATALADDQQERAVKERAYVSALNKLGVPLLPIVDELEGK